MRFPSLPLIFPPRMWPRRYQVLLLGGALAVSLLLVGAWVQHAKQAHALALAQLDGEKIRQAAAGLNPAVPPGAADAPSLPPLPHLPVASVVDALVRDMTVQAKERGVLLANVSIERQRATAATLSLQQLSISARGSYKDLKAWTGAMLSAYPWLAVKSLTFSKGGEGVMGAMGAMGAMGTVGAEHTQVDAVMVWVLYVQD